MTGTGTVSDPYIIYTWDELLSTIVQSEVYIEFGADIDCKELGAITPTQIYKMNFTYLDGKGYALKNLYLRNSGNVFQGARSNTIANLSFKNVYMDNVLGLFSFDSSHPLYLWMPTFRNCHFSAELVNGSGFISLFTTAANPPVFRQCTFHIKCDNSQFTIGRRLADDRYSMLLDDCVVELYGTYHMSCLSAQLIDSLVVGEVTMLTADEDYLNPIIKIQNAGSYQSYTPDFIKANSIVNLKVHNNTNHNLHVYVNGSNYYDINGNPHPCTGSLFINTEDIDNIELFQQTQCNTCTAAQIADEEYLTSHGFIAEYKWEDRYVRKSALICESYGTQGVGAHIDTGIINTRYRQTMVEWEYTKVAAERWAMGAVQTEGFNGGVLYGTDNGTAVYSGDYGEQTVNISGTPKYGMVGTKFIAKSTGSGWNSYQNTYNLIINGRVVNGDIQLGMDGKIYHAAIWETDNSLLRDFYPAYDTQNNEYGMYDTANNVFYGSSNPDAKFSGADNMPFKFVNGKIVHHRKNDSSLSIISIPRMEYHNTYTKEYLTALRQKRCAYKMKLELLSDSETVIGDIEKDLENVGGQLNINYERITRRSCSLSLTNIDGKYLPSKNSHFWYKRKFKLWIGLVVKDNIYWWSQGVFYTKSANVENGTVMIEAVDKGAALDGTLKLNMADAQYLIKHGASLTNLIKDTLSRAMGANDLVIRGQMNMTNSSVIDPVPPYIHTKYNSEIVQSDISIDANAYIGDIFVQLCGLYNAEAYYNTEGHFCFEPCIDNSGYTYSPLQWEFTDLSSTYEDVNYSYSFEEGENTICVYTNTSSAGVKNVAWTAYNTNPLSPLNISVGIRRAPHQEIEYYNMEDNTAEINIAKQELAEIQTEIADKGIDVNRTVYGNIDTNSRQKLSWTEQNLEKFADAIESWGYTADELAGSISTVMGTSSEFDGVEIAFSPILQTQDGAILLTEEIVSEYIWGLIDNAGEGWTDEELLALDAEGLEFDDLLVKNLIADIGDSAILTGEAMHYVGKYGALAMAQKRLTKLENKNEEQQIKDCRSAANYYLRHYSLLGMQLTFNCPIIPHMDVNKTIDVSDSVNNIANGVFVVQSITMPLNSNKMNVNCTNINWLPNDTVYDGVGR